MRIAELALPRSAALLIAAVALLGLSAPRSAQALTMEIDEAQSNIFVAGQIGTWSPADAFNVDIVGMNLDFTDIFFPDVSANLGFGEFYKFTVQSPVTAAAPPGMVGHVTTNPFNVLLEFVDGSPLSSTVLSVVLTTQSIPLVSCGVGGVSGSYGQPLDASGNLRLEGIVCASLGGAFTDQFVTFKIDGALGSISVPEPGALVLMGLLLTALAFTRRRVES